MCVHCLPCQVCGARVAKKVTYDDRAAPHSPFFWWVGPAPGPACSGVVLQSIGQVWQSDARQGRSIAAVPLPPSSRSANVSCSLACRCDDCYGLMHYDAEVRHHMLRAGCLGG